MLDDDTNLARWLMNLSSFAANMYLKHPRVEMQGLLQVCACVCVRVRACLRARGGLGGPVCREALPGSKTALALMLYLLFIVTAALLAGALVACGMCSASTGREREEAPLQPPKRCLACVPALPRCPAAGCC